MSFPFESHPAFVEAAPTPGFEADALDIARRIFDGQGQLARVAYVEDPRGRHLFPVPVPHPSQPRVGDALMRALADVLAANGAVGVAQLAECWTVATTAEGRQAMPVDLADADGRVEVVMVLVEHYDVEGGLTRAWRAAITRDAAGRPTLGPWLLTTGSVASGRMIGLLRPRGGAA